VSNPGNAACAALLLRTTLGSLFIAHLYWKFAIRGFEPWWSALHAAGYPDALLIYVLCAEFAGALLLIPGIATRWVSLFTLPAMLGAAQFWWTRKGFFFVDAGAELPLLWAVALLVQALLGDGAFSLGARWLRRENRLASHPLH